MLHHGKKMEKQKTPIIKNSLNPKFDQYFNFKVPMKMLREIQFEIAVMDYDSIGRNDTIGKVNFFSTINGYKKVLFEMKLKNNVFKLIVVIKVIYQFYFFFSRFLFSSFL